MIILMFWTVVGLLLAIAVLVGMVAIGLKAAQNEVANALYMLIAAEQEQTAQFKAARETRELTREGRDLLRQRLAQRAKEAKH